MPADIRLEADHRNARMMQQINVWRDELIAWFKTLFSAAIYATLIVTFGFQVARVEGQSMAPTLEDQDRLIVNKLVYGSATRAAATSSCSTTRSTPRSRS
jgi:Tfp pilus assembly protein PilV